MDHLPLQNTAAAKQWELIGIKHHDGINLPLFSLRSQASCGIGEFPDLIPLFSWCQELQLDTIQLLPLNDNGLETSPYNALSAFALNPLHLGLTRLPEIENSPQLLEQIHDLQSLNDRQRIAYPLVQEGKERFLWEYYRLFFPSISTSESYRLFIEQNPWLHYYALYKAINVHKGWESWENWKENDVENLLELYQKDVDFHIFVQYLCFQQFEDIKNLAREHGIYLKGDIPILINRESADVWAHRSFFQLQYFAGSPPDMYSKEGQKWGFPIYNWDELENDQYLWWIRRLQVASRLYDLYRLDHIVGFFRIWAVPLQLSGSHGKFIPEDRSQWIPQGEKIMRMMLENSSMLPIGEDLGDVPPEVRICLRSLGICGTKVMRWERYWEGDKSFIDLESYIPESMTTVSTHDSETLYLWWKNSPEEAKIYAESKGWIYHAEITPDQQFSILYDSHHTPSLFHINLLQEYLALVPGMTWPDPSDERINIPGLVLERNWTYRFRPFVEEIVTDERLKDTMKNILGK